MQNLKFTIAAGETKRFEITGRYLEIIDSAGPLDVDLTDTAGGIADRATGVLSGTYMGTAYRGFSVRSDTAQTVELFLSETNGGTKRQPGNVSVIDSSAAKTMAGRQFMQSAAASGAGYNIVSVQANGASVAVRKVMINSATAGEVLIGTSTSQGTATPGGTAMANKQAGGAAATARLTSGSAAGVAPTGAEVPGYAQFLRIQVPANTPVWLDVSAAPFVLTGTRGLCVLGVASGRDVTVAFECEEVG